MKNTIDFLGMGALNVDTIHKSNISVDGSNIRTSQVSIHAGGSSANTISALSRIGFKCGFVGRVGTDRNPEILLSDFIKSKVDISQISKNHTLMSGQAHSYVDELGNRAITIKPEANNTLKRNQVNINTFLDSKWIHYSSFIGEEQNDLQVKVAQELNRKVKSSLLVDEYIHKHGYRNLAKILPHIYTLFIKETTIIHLLGLNLKDAAEQLLKGGTQEVVIIRNYFESEVYTKEEHHHMESLSSPIIDATGMSSAFIAGYLYGKIKQFPLRNSLIFGNAMMSFCGEKIGPRSNFPTYHELLKRYHILKPEKNILIVGSGGREHALAWKFNQSNKVHRLYVAPGNAGISNLAQIVPLKETNIKGIRKFAQRNDIDLTIVGPEVPLSQGIVNEFEKRGLPIFGPTKNAALIESSKIFAKEFMKKFNIPSAKYEKFKKPSKAFESISKMQYPIVIKADGLAAGKGVYICKNRKQATTAIDELMVKKIFGKAGKSIIIEEFLTGQEASILAFSDGIHIIPLIPAQDHKAAYDGDKGPNTGGMGAFAPAKIVTPILLEKIVKTILEPTIKGMQEIGRTYIGVLFAGVILTKEGPKVLEFNCRFGDPETQAILPLLKSDLVDILGSVFLNKLRKEDFAWDNKYCTCVVLASEGYPSRYDTGHEITFKEQSAINNGMSVFHSGTKSRILSSGGRVVGVFSTANTLRGAIRNSYEKVKKVQFKNMYHRTDIGKKGLKK